jgi:hypothetical protein
MPLQVQTSLMSGGLDLATPPIAIPPGRCIAAINYEPDVAGYSSMPGYERFDGHERPSDTSNPTLAEERRARIAAVPGTGPVRGVWVFNGDVYAFRDQASGLEGMFKATLGGWEAQSFGSMLPFTLGTAEFVAGEYVAGVTSGAAGRIERVILREGVWDGTASGYLIISRIVGTFASAEIIISGAGSATGQPTQTITMLAGGRYDFSNHNFYGATDRARMYFCSGADTAFEWNGSVLTPIHTGITSGDVALGVVYLLAPEAPIAAGQTILAADDSVIIMSAQFDAPTFVTHFMNHLFLGFSSGTLLNSSLGEPLEYVTTTGAGEIAFGQPITGLLTAASTSLVVFAQNRIDYITGTDSASFELRPVSDVAGAQPYTVQQLDTPVYLDDSGLRQMPTTAAFGDWRMGSMTPLIESLIRQKRDTDIQPVGSIVIKGKDQYRLFWADGSGLTVYIGRKNPEPLPFKLPVLPYCACNGEVEIGQGDRLFIGCQDGFVYEQSRGTSFDGEPITSYIRLPFTAAGSPAQHTRWTKATFELDTPDDITIGVAFHVDYARGVGGEKTDVEVDAGTSIITTGDYSEIDWTQPVEGRLEYHLAGIGPNIAATLVHSASNKRPHTISSQTYNFSRRGLKR